MLLMGFYDSSDICKRLFCLNVSFLDGACRYVERAIKDKGATEAPLSKQHGWIHTGTKKPLKLAKVKNGNQKRRVTGTFVA